MKYLALLGELGWRKLEERRKEKKMMYGTRLHGWEGPEWCGGKLLINERMIEELFGGEKITKKSTASV